MNYLLHLNSMQTQTLRFIPEKRAALQSLTESFPVCDSARLKQIPSLLVLYFIFFWATLCFTCLDLTSYSY